MKRLHVHVAVENLAQSTRFYSTLFAAEPTVEKDDYVKWMLEDPRVNFAISARPGRSAGISHLGIQVEDEAELAEVYDRLARAERPIVEAKATTCCYARSDKQWIADPQGVPWETFFTYGDSTVYGEGSLARPKEISEAACCEPEAIPQAGPEPAAASACCAPAGATVTAMDDAQIKEMVRARYGGIAEAAGADSCCSPASSCCGDTAAGKPADKSRQMGYSDADLAAVPDGANLGLGCGNPQAIAALEPDEVVVDLGSGAGFDCFLAARQVGHAGHVIGVDMTHEMLKKARENAASIGAANVEFPLGELEHLPVADDTADAILSNCVINLVPDKAQPRSLPRAETWRAARNLGCRQYRAADIRAAGGYRLVVRLHCRRGACRTDRELAHAGRLCRCAGDTAAGEPRADRRLGARPRDREFRCLCDRRGAQARRRQPWMIRSTTFCSSAPATRREAFSPKR